MLNKYAESNKTWVHLIFFGIFSLTIGGILLFAILKLTPIVTLTPELMGSGVLKNNINIHNRLLAVGVCFASSTAIFIYLVSSKSSGFVIDDIVYKSIGFFPLEKNILIWVLSRIGKYAGFPRHLLDLFLNINNPSASLLSERKSHLYDLPMGIIMIMAIPSAIMTVCTAVVANKIGLEKWNNNFILYKNILTYLNILMIYMLFRLWLASAFIWFIRYVFLLQSVLLCFFLKLIPYRFNNGTELISIFNNSRIYKIVSILVILGIIEIIVKFRKSRKMTIYSRMSIYALLLGYSFPDGLPFDFWLNPVEITSRIIPYWMSYSEGSALFHDIQITYGLYDYVGCHIGAWLFNDSINSFAIGLIYIGVILQAIVFILSDKLIPLWASFLIAYFLIAHNSLAGSVSFVWIYYGLLILPALWNNKHRWLLIWLILTYIWPFARIPQGAICAISSLPFAFWQIVLFYKDNNDNKRKTYGFFILSGVMVMSLLVWPFSRQFFGFMGFFYENAKINSIWAATAVISKDYLSMSFFFWLPLIAVAIIYYINEKSLKISYIAKNAICLWLFSFAFIYMTSAISYSFSRMNSQNNIRAYQTVLAISGILFFTIWRAIHIGSVKFILSALMFYIMGYHGINDISIWNVNNRFQREYKIIDASEFGLDRFGKGTFEDQFKWLNRNVTPETNLKEELILKENLDNILEPEETYLDLTMEGHYYVQNRKCHVEFPVYYTFTGDRSQKRAMNFLNERNIKVALLDGSIVYDESPVNLRAFYLYRYALLNGMPYEISPFKTILMPNSHFEKIKIKPPDKLEALQILDRQFPKMDFGHLPYTWGRNYDNLESPPIELYNLTNDIFNDYEYLHTLNFKQTINGRTSDLLLLDVEILKGEAISMQVSWENMDFPNENNHVEFIAHNGINLIPLSSSPRWLLADKIGIIKILNPSDRKFKLGKIKLLKRNYE